MRVRTEKIDRYTDFDGYKVTLTIPWENAPQIDDYLASNAGKEMVVDIKVARKHRSITANNYFWVLCEEIAKATGGSKEAIYKAIIGRVGVWTFHLVRKDAVDNFRRIWADNGLGWWSEILPVHGTLYDANGNEIEDVVQLVLYYGSSTYDSQQMARIIDEAISEAKNLGIPTDTKEAKEYLEQWEKGLSK